MKWRLLKDGAQGGARNMAIDEALLLHCARDENSAPALRFYAWQPACLSLGRFQRIADVPSLSRAASLSREYSQPLQKAVSGQPSSALDGQAARTSQRSTLNFQPAFDWVRRPTGGRAVWHQDEITYCVVLRESLLPRESQSVVGAYEWLSRAFLGGLFQLGVNAELAPLAKPESASTRNATFRAGAAREIAIEEIRRRENMPRAKASDEIAIEENAERENATGGIAFNENAPRSKDSDTIAVCENAVRAKDSDKNAERENAIGENAARDANCFHSATRADFLTNGKKLIGAAQMRRGGVVLQHGSILLSIDEAAWRASTGGAMTSAIALRDLGVTASRGEIIDALCESFQSALNATLHETSLSAAEEEIASTRAAQKYRNAAWNEAAREPFSGGENVANAL